ncbi:MAG: hypothetical protein ACKOBW_06560 [Planctomycetota bacterium]
MRSIDPPHMAAALTAGSAHEVHDAQRLPASSRIRRPVLVTASLLLLLMVPAASGCIGLASQLLYVIKGDKVAAEFDGLAGKRVAVVCVANSSNYDPGSASSKLAQMVEIILKKEVPRISLIRQDRVVDWIDNNDWDQMDYRDVGRGLKAEMVVGIDLDGYRLHEDATMYRGKANVVITVFDVKANETVYKRHLTGYSFPSNGGKHVSETTEAQFQSVFLTELAIDIAKTFHAYEFKNDFARDASMLSR